MTPEPLFASMLGIWEIVLILSIFLVPLFIASVVALIAFLVVRGRRPPATEAPHPIAPVASISAAPDVIVSAKTAFRLLVVAEVLVGIMTIITYFVGEPFLPEPLRNFDDQQMRHTSLPVLLMVLAFCLLLLLALVISWIGLVLFWRPARWLYVVVTVIGLLTVTAMGPYVETGVSYALGQVTSILSGIIIGLMFWGTARELFEKRSAA